MRKALVLISTLFFVLAICSMAFAASNKVSGKIKSIDAAKGEVVVTPKGSKTDKTLKVSSEMIKKKMMKPGEVYNFILEKEGSDVVTKANKALTVPVGC